MAEEEQAFTVSLPQTIRDSLKAFKVKGFADGMPEPSVLNKRINRAFMRLIRKFNKFLRIQMSLNQTKREAGSVPEAILK